MYTERTTELWSLVTADLDTIDLAHAHDHIQRVTHWAKKIAESLQPDEPRFVELCVAAAIVHDLDNIPKESPDRALGGERSAIAAEGPLRGAGFCNDERAQITAALMTSSWSKGLPPTNQIGVVLQDADRLDAIGAIGILRNSACAQAISCRGNLVSFYNSSDPMGSGNRLLDDKRYAIDHYELKLLRLIEGFHTPLGKQEAQRRHQRLEVFLSWVEDECTMEAP